VKLRGMAVFEALLYATILAAAAARASSAFPVPAIEYAPSRYAAVRVSYPPVIDGALDDAAWARAGWTGPFQDIEGRLKPQPRFATRAKMAWDDECFYVAAELEEPDLWATLTARDAVIYHENDFEVFIDPDGDTHEYSELEMNALNTVWDLLLVKSYRDGGPAVNAWDIANLRTAVKLDGTLNDPSDEDAGWTLEIAIPWKVLAECAHRSAPPQSGDSWWINFSRVEWRREVVEGRYGKSRDPATGKDLPEDNWVWSPQGLIAMHYPERWGLVTFVEAATDAPELSAEDLLARQALWQLYYAQKGFQEQHGGYAASLDELPPREPPLAAELRLEACGGGYEATFTAPGGVGLYHLRDDGRLWRDELP
jgi:hypothetical protein